MSEVSSQRVVPGAPPPAPLSRSQRKKRKTNKPKSEGNSESPVTVPDATSAALFEKALEPSGVREGSLVSELVVDPEVQASPLPEEDVLLKPSPIVDLVHKRLKATTKKISRITIYAATDPEKLNDDQKRTLKTLPTLEAVQKELGEVKKAIEVHEAELVHELTARRIEADKAEKARIENAVSAAEGNLLSKTLDILNLLRLRSSLASGSYEDAAYFSDESERSAFFSVADALLGEENDLKQSAVHGFMFCKGDFDGVAYPRIAEIVQLLLNPPRVPTPVQEPIVDDTPESVSSVESSAGDVEAPAIGVPEPVTMSSSFHFMQESELEGPTFEDSAEWVERPDTAEAQEESISPVAAVPEAAPVNGHATGFPSVGGGGSTLDWSAEYNDAEGDLPSIAEFKPSGSATPAEVAEETAQPVPTEDGYTPPSHQEEDGFTTARGGRGGRGRGVRGERGERGGFRHNFRGGERGGFRGGDRGGFRGGFRGGDRGGFRARGEWRGDGERGRGRGRGRGDRGGPHPHAPSAPATPS